MTPNRSVCSMMAAALLALPAIAPAQNIRVNSTVPSRHALNIALTSTIAITFDRAVDLSTITPSSFRVLGRWSGPVSGSFALSNADRTLTFTPSGGWMFSAGEIVFVNLTRAIRGADGTALQNGGYAYQFWTRTARASMQFNQIGTMSNRSNPNISTRIYGAVASDLNRDTFLDLTTINEDSHDIRVFMNRADQSGLYFPFLTPPLPIGIEASPNEAGDFNNDGFVDVAAAASSSHSVWIALGRGDGTFNPAQEVAVGTTPHGLAAFDADGDGDWDLATSNYGSNNVSLMLNNGAGVFSPATHFDSGGNGEYGITAADMNNDGMYDLVVGCRDSQTINMLRNTGSGGFVPFTPRPAGGLVWMVVAGNVNNDANMDITTANSGSNSGSILIGNGAGSLAAPVVTPAANHCVATDLGDLDGDGDLDWLLSSFGGGEWRIFTNNGFGAFTYNQTFYAQSNPSCAILLDLDNDRDLDLALTDEIADIITLYKNRGPLVDGDMNCDGLIDSADIAPFVQALLDPAGYDAQFPHCLRINGDFNNDNQTNANDVSGFTAVLLG